MLINKLFGKLVNFLTFFKVFLILNILITELSISKWFYRIVDNMPMAWCYDTTSQQKFCNPGFPIGCFVGPDGVKHDACQIDVRV